MKQNQLGKCIACLTLAGIFMLSSCQKNVQALQEESTATAGRSSSSSAANDRAFLPNQHGLSETTIWELQQARAASAKYKNLAVALADGYTDIGVYMPHMGHHFMKSSLVDANFDYRKPEILVYNKTAPDTYELVAVEYAVPLNLPMPSGFTGSNDVWNGTSGFPLWLLHAWVWEMNPDGVFTGMNPNVNSLP